MARTLGVDTNHWEGKVNSDLMALRGVRFNIAKFSDFVKWTNNGFLDTQFAATYRGHKANGILIGGYHWLQPSSDHEAQARYYLDNAKGYALDIPPVVDFEDEAGRGSSNYLWKAQEWLKIVEQETGRTPILYTASGFIRDFPKEKLGWMVKYPLWLAQYTFAQLPPTVPYPWSNWTFWQYTDKGDGRYYGCESLTIDMDYYNGSYDDLLAYCGTVTPPVQETLFIGEVTASILNVRTSPDTGAVVKRQLKRGDLVKVKQIHGDEVWYKLDDGLFVAGRYDGETYIQERGTVANN